MAIDPTLPTALKPIAPLGNGASVSSKETAGATLWGEDGFSFDDLIDIINPLQHIPIVSTLYREITGDTISTGASVAGGALLGGAVGFAASLIDAGIKNETGKDIGENVIAMLTPDSSANQSQLANADAAPQKVAQLDGPSESQAILSQAIENAGVNYSMPQLHQNYKKQQDNWLQPVAAGVNITS